MRRWPPPEASGPVYSTERVETLLLTQAAEICVCLALGLCLGFIYDVLRVPRHLAGAWGFLFDILFCLIMGGSLFVLGMACGGVLRFYMPFAAALGAGVYWLSFGRWLSPFFRKVESYGAKALRGLNRLIKKLNKIFKNIFSIGKKRFRMIGYTKDGKLGMGMSKSGARRAQRKGEDHEISRTGHTCKSCYPGPSDICSFYAGGFRCETGGGAESAGGASAAGGDSPPGE